MKNIIQNAFKKNFFLTMLKKIIKRLEKNTSVESTMWANQNVKQDTEQYCRSIDSNLYDEIISDVNEIKKFSLEKLSNLNFSMGGGGNYILLYFLIRKFRPLNIVETGVAAGWTSLAILRAIKKNQKGNLYSSDFPYFRLKNPEKYVGYLALDEDNKKNWYLDIRGDDVALPSIIKKIPNGHIDLFHYDSDKSYSGRQKAFNTLSVKFSKSAIIIFDDIQNNLHFKNLVETSKKKFTVLKFKNKFLGIINY